MFSEKLRRLRKKAPEARRSWFDKLTMTYNIACPEPAEGKEKAQRIWTFTKPGDQLRLTETSVETPCFRIVTP